jgi:hypothetical protein
MLRFKLIEKKLTICKEHGEDLVGIDEDGLNSVEVRASVGH